MLLRVTNISGFVLLWYLTYHRDMWSININKASTLSPYVVGFIHSIPKPLITLLLVLLLLGYLYSIITNRGASYFYLISLALFHVLVKISISTLMLDNTTMFLCMEINHEVPSEWKYNHFENTLYYSITSNVPELLTNMETLQQFHLYLNNNIDIEKIKELNATQIAEYANQCITEHFNNEYVAKDRSQRLACLLFLLGYVAYLILTRTL